MSAAFPHPANDGERLVKLETEMGQVRVDLGRVEGKVDHLAETTATKTDMQALTDALTKFTTACDQKYASKNVERLVYGMVAIVLSAFVAALLKIIGVY